MKKIIFIILTCMLSMAAFAQSFDIPTAPEKTKVQKAKDKEKVKEAKAKEKAKAKEIKEKAKEKKAKERIARKEKRKNVSTESPSLKKKENRKNKIPKIPATTQDYTQHQARKATAPDLTAGKSVEGIERSMSVEELENRASQGDINAHTTLGMFYFQQDDERSLPHLRAGAEGGDRLAQYFLGGVYYFGKFGVEVDKAMAAAYYLKSAQQEHAPAQYGVAICLYNGEGVEQDKKAAKEWMERAAKNNSEDARKFLETHSFE